MEPARKECVYGTVEQELIRGRDPEIPGQDAQGCARPRRQVAYVPDRRADRDPGVTSEDRRSAQGGNDEVRLSPGHPDRAGIVVLVCLCDPAGPIGDHTEVACAVGESERNIEEAGNSVSCQPRERWRRPTTEVRVGSRDDIIRRQVVAGRGRGRGREEVVLLDRGSGPHPQARAQICRAHRKRGGRKIRLDQLSRGRSREKRGG